MLSWAAGGTFVRGDTSAQSNPHTRRWAFLIPASSQLELVVIAPASDGTDKHARTLIFTKDKQGWKFDRSVVRNQSIQGFMLVPKSLGAPQDMAIMARSNAVQVSPALPQELMDAEAQAKQVMWALEGKPKTLPQDSSLVPAGSGAALQTFGVSATQALRSYSLMENNRTGAAQNPKYRISTCGVVDNSYFSQPPFNKDGSKFPLSGYKGDPTSLTADQIASVEHWLLGYASVANATPNAAKGGYDFAATLLIKDVSTENGVIDIHYQTLFGGLCKWQGQVKDTYSPEHYGINPEADVGIFNLPVVQAVAKVLPRFPSWLSMSLPAFDNDSSYGFSQSTDVTIKPPDSKVWSFDIAGQNSFSHDYYQVSGTAKETVNDVTSLTEKVGKEILPKGGSVENDISGEAGAAFNLLDSKNLSRANADDAYTLKLGTDAKATEKTLNSKTTDEYSLTLDPQAVYYFFDPAPSPDVGTGLGYDGEVDGTTWVVPTDSAPGGYYTNADGRVHVGCDLDAEKWPGFTRPDASGTVSPQMLRLDAALSGGGVLGPIPSQSDYIYGGNNLTEGIASGLPSPVVRSIGSNQAAVYSRTGGKSGADSYANFNFTAALPVPGLPLSYGVVRQNNCVDGVENALSTKPDPGGAKPSEDPSIAQDRLDYLANLYGFSFKPLFVCDAAWMGAPRGFRNRSLVAVGGGGEFSVGALNFDLVYATTVVDSAHQPPGENIVFQVTYDWHF